VSYILILEHFLDLNTHLKDSIITTDLYVKPTDTHQYLHPHSCHPGHIKRSIPFSQTLRILNICSEHDTANHHIQKLIEHLTKRVYSKNKVQRQVYKAKQNRSLKSILPQHPPLHLPTGSHSKATNKQHGQADLTPQISSPPTGKVSKPHRVPLVLTYHPGHPDISTISCLFYPQESSKHREICLRLFLEHI
jgi:hypothetical protein